MQQNEFQQAQLGYKEGIKIEKQTVKTEVQAYFQNLFKENI